MLQVDSSVRGASVHINYEEVGQVPLTRYLPAGTYTVRVSANGFDPFVRRVTISPNLTQTLNAQLMQGGGSVEFYVKPGGARVLLDGRDVGVTPIRLTDVPVGSHRYEISRDGYEGLTGEFNLVDGGNPLITHTLESSEGKWAVISRPKGAEVYIDGELVGETPLELTGIPSEPHTVTLVKEGYAIMVRSVDTTGGLRGEVDATLNQEGTKVTVKTGAGEGEVVVNGIPAGSGRATKLIMARGDYLMQVEAPGQPTITSTVEVPLAGAVIFKADYDEQALIEVPPLYRRWWFWAAVGGGAVGAGAAVGITAAALQPDPPPSGDVTVTLP